MRVRMAAVDPLQPLGFSVKADKGLLILTWLFALSMKFSH
jgi:hypothetical protein